MAALPDLITEDYANAALAAYPFTQQQKDFIPFAIPAASNEIRRWCMDRDFTQTTYIGEVYQVTLDGYIRLNQIPVNQIIRVQGQLQEAITISNTSPSVTSSQVLYAYSGDVATGQTVTGLTLNWQSSGYPFTTTIPYTSTGTGTISVTNGMTGVTFSVSQSGLIGKYISVTGDTTNGQYLVTSGSGTSWTLSTAYGGTNAPAAAWGVDVMTINDLATLINAVGSGWSANADQQLGAWPVGELYNGFIGIGTSENVVGQTALMVFSEDIAGACFHPDDGQKTGLVWTGMQYSGLGPRWGPYPMDWDYTSNTPSIVKVSYNAGFATIPAIVQLACAEGVRVILQRMRYNPYLESFRAGEVAYTVAKTMMQALPPYILQELSQYRISNA